MSLLIIFNPTNVVVFSSAWRYSIAYIYGRLRVWQTFDDMYIITKGSRLSLITFELIAVKKSAVIWELPFFKWILPVVSYNN
jgi:hypothetical protein